MNNSFGPNCEYAQVNNLSSAELSPLYLQECMISKTFGKSTDNVVFVLDKGVFNMTSLVDTLTTGLTSVLGEFSSLTGGIVSAPTVSPILNAVNAATSLLG
jgi:hypothetical protein